MATLRGTRRCAMRKLYVVRLTAKERGELKDVNKKLKGAGQKVRRAQILLKADADGPNWTDERIADAFSCRTRTVERLRQRFVEQGFEEALLLVHPLPPAPRFVEREAELEQLRALWRGRFRGVLALVGLG